MGNKDLLKYIASAITEQQAADFLNAAPVAYTIGQGEYKIVKGKFVDNGGSIHSPAGVPRITKIRVLENGPEIERWGKAEMAVKKTPTGTTSAGHERELTAAGVNTSRTVPYNSVKSTADGELHDRKQNPNMASKAHHAHGEVDERKHGAGEGAPPAPPTP